MSTKRLIAIAAFLWPLLAAAQVGHRIPGSEVTVTGGFPYATVRVCTEPATGVPCTPLASIYSDPGLSVPLSNPLTSDGSGNYGYYANPGTAYHEQITGNGLQEYDIPYIYLPSNTLTAIQIETNSTVNASQSLVNFTSTTGAGGITATNPSGGLEEFTVANIQGTDGNLLSSGTISSSAGVTLCTDSSHGATTSGCTSSGVTIDTNGTNNTSQALLNFVNITSSAGGISFTNPSGGVESATVSNVQGTDAKLLSSGTISGSAAQPICTDSNGGATTSGCPSGGGGGNPLLENCTSDQTGNSFYNVTSLTNWFSGHWEFIYNTTTGIYCEVYVPTAQTGATIVLDVYSADATAGHTANFQTCDVQVTTGSFQVGSLTCASNQTYTTTSTAYQRVTLTFNVQSTLSNGGILAVKIGTSPTGTAPTSDLLILPHFIL